MTYTKREDTNKAARVRYHRDHDKHLLSQKKSRIERRRKVLNHYGGKCSCCGEDKYEFLSIDHVNGGGRKHREEIKENIDRWIIRNNFPKGFRVLCHNCNQSLGLYGYCPHNVGRSVVVTHDSVKVARRVRTS